MLEMKVYTNENQYKVEMAECQEGDISSSLSAEIKDFAKAGNYACLAAPQVGIFKRFFVMEGSLYVNPFVEEIAEKGVSVFEECENFPEKRIESKRYLWIEVSYLENGERVTKRFRENEAQYVQFCMDWLDGTLGKVVEMIKQPTVVNEKVISRNDPCICGSGKKYKKCCG